MTTTTLRDYQNEAVDAVYADFSRGILRPAVLLPTGSGKTTIYAALIVRHLRSGGRKVVVIAHRRTLVRQGVTAIVTALSEAGLSGYRVGTVMGAQDDTDADVVVSSIATLSRSPERIDDIGPVDLVIYDEVHHSPAPSSLSVLKRLGVFSRVRFVGMTATLERGDDVGLGSVIQHVAYTRDIEWMIGKGYLVRPITVRITATSPQELARAYGRAAGKRQGIVFTGSLKNAEAITAAFNAAGIPAAMIDGTTSDEIRDAVYADIVARETQVLVNVGVATEGFDLPQLEVAVLDRNVGSHGLYVQIVGRVLRLSPGKRAALVLLVSGGALRGTGQPLSTVADLRDGQVASASPRATRSRKATGRTARPVRYDLKITTTAWGGHKGTLRADGRVVAVFKGSPRSIQADAQIWANSAPKKR